ncbi:MAG: hypothetical protein NC300_07245 [Bacteroidales bacterium]|nr:hypothetical protein [Clostridium sp.]MCM1203922.1 hypothetical protein [Bacteroidales bacterium]
MSRIKSIQAGGQGTHLANQNGIQRKNAERNGGQNKKAAVFAGNWQMGTDSILEKKKKAQREAMKIISDVFKSDLKTDGEQKDRLAHIDELKEKNVQNKTKLKDIDDMQQSLMDEYEVDEDSQEKKDLDLLRKAREVKANPFTQDKLTEEEEIRYQQLQEQGLTEYQEQALALDEDTKEIQSAMRENKRDIAVEEAAYKETQMELLKKAPMAGAREQAEKILEAAGKEIAGELYQQAKEHIDEKAEEAREEQKKLSEQKKEEEKEEALKEAKALERELLLKESQEEAKSRAEALRLKEKAKGQAALTEQFNTDAIKSIDMDTYEAGLAEQEMRELLEKMKLLQEDLKGAAVDDIV